MKAKQMIRSVLALLLTASISHAGDDRFGFCTHFQQGWNTNILPAIAATGVGWIRDNITTTDVYYTKAHAVGLKVCVIVGNVSGATMAVNNGWADAIEVLNEPNNISTYQGTSGEMAEVTLTNQIYTAVHAISNIPVIGLGQQGSEIIAMLGMSPTVDGVVYHPYYQSYYNPEGAFEPPWLVYDQWVSELRSQTSLPSWETEWGFENTKSGVTTYQPKLIGRRLLEEAGLGIAHSFIYEYQNNGTEVFGVVGTAGMPVVERIISSLQGVIGTGAITGSAVGNTNLKAYAFQGPAGTIVAYWLGNNDVRTPPAATTATLTFTASGHAGAHSVNALDGTTAPVNQYAWSQNGSQWTCTGIPVDDTPRMIVIPTTAINPPTNLYFGN